MPFVEILECLRLWVRRGWTWGSCLDMYEEDSRPKAGERFRFIVPEGSPFPILVTDQHMRERSEWTITPSIKCGMSELFNTPSALMRLCFPALAPDEKVEMFTAFCPCAAGRRWCRRTSLRVEPSLLGTFPSQLVAKKGAASMQAFSRIGDLINRILEAMGA